MRMSGYENEEERMRKRMSMRMKKKGDGRDVVVIYSLLE